MALTPPKTQKRKTGDTLRLSGQFAVVAPVVPVWAGSSAKLNITKDDDARTMWRPDEPVQMDMGVSPPRYLYEGDPALDAEAGDYLYEIEVTFSDGTVTTFPNDRYGYKLQLVTELG